jgi:hypothetical protein
MFGTMPVVGATWLASVSGSGVDDLVALRPDLAALLAEFRGESRGALGDRLCDLLTIRAAQLIGDGDVVARADPALVAQATSWPTDPAVGDLERACLDLCESFIMDAHAVTDDQVVAVQALLGDAGTIAVLMHLALVDGFTKFHRVFAGGVS